MIPRYTSRPCQVSGRWWVFDNHTGQRIGFDFTHRTAALAVARYLSIREALRR